MQLRCRRQRRKSSSVQAIFEAFLFGLQDLGHIAANHPADVDANLFLLRPTRAHDGLPPLATAREAPSVGAPRLRSRSR